MRHARDDDSSRILRLGSKLNAELQRSGSMGAWYRGPPSGAWHTLTILNKYKIEDIAD
jgi:hypothetical protein